MQAEEEKRRLVDLAIQAGRKRKSTQTGFIHHCYESESNQHDTIPLYENLCYVLALFRSRIADNIKEGKVLLEKLLSFQMNGNFPVYLHEYPHCKDMYFCFHLLPIFHFIKEDFFSILGESLGAHFKKAIQEIIHYIPICEKTAPFPIEINGKIKAFQKNNPFENWHPRSIEHWNHFLLALQMASLEDQKKHLEAAALHWHPNLHCYDGAFGKHLHKKTEPAPSFFDLCMSSLFGSYPKRVLEDSILHLKAALIHPPSFRIEPKQVSDHAYSMCLHEEGERAFTLRWGNKEHLHSLVAVRVNCDVQSDLNQDTCLLTFQLPETPPLEAEDEVALFFDKHEDNEIFINGKKAILFTLQDEVQILSKEHKITISFSQEGEGMFAGHLLRGNRPSQIANKGENLFEAYDWKIGIRTLRRENNCRIKVFLKIFLDNYFSCTKVNEVPNRNDSIH